jgi:hypothetical protein
VKAHKFHRDVETFQYREYDKTHACYQENPPMTAHLFPAGRKPRILLWVMHLMSPPPTL